MGVFVDATSRIYDAALALVYPQPCNVCGASVESRCDGVACRDCWNETKLLLSDEGLCWKCGVLVPVSSTVKNVEGIRCHRCEEFSFTAARAYGLYEGALRASIIALKRKPHVSEKLILGMVELCKRSPLNRGTLVVPVPLHQDREKERGFNQASLLAVAIAQPLKLFCGLEVLSRVEPTARHRAGMDAKSRRQSVERAFVVSIPNIVVGESVLLVDDVYTTGATVSSCSDALLIAGAKEVLVLTLARPRHV